MEDAIFVVVPLLGLLCLRRRPLDRAFSSREETALLGPEVCWALPCFSDEAAVASKDGDGRRR